LIPTPFLEAFMPIISAHRAAPRFRRKSLSNHPPWSAKPLTDKEILYFLPRSAPFFAKVICANREPLAEALRLVIVESGKGYAEDR